MGEGLTHYSGVEPIKGYTPFEELDPLEQAEATEAVAKYICNANLVGTVEKDTVNRGKVLIRLTSGMLTESTYGIFIGKSQVEEEK